MPFSSWEGVIESILRECSFVRKWLSEGERQKREMVRGRAKWKRPWCRGRERKSWVLLQELGEEEESRQLTSHPPVLLQLPGGYKHGDLSVSPVPEILHCHGNATAGEEVLEAVAVGVGGVRG